jgi:hypothetical protein
VELICNCWLIDESVSKYGLTVAERKLAMMDRLAWSGEAGKKDPDPSQGSEAAEIEMLVARKASHYVHKKDIHSGTDWDEIKLLCGRPAMNSGKELGLPAILHRIAKYNAQERASCEDCVRLTGYVPVHMVERDIY